MTLFERKIRQTKSYRMMTNPWYIIRSTWLLVGMFAALAFIALVTPWQQTAVGFGKVIAFSPGERVQRITANIEGRVEKWYVREGMTVQEGDLLAKMVDNDPEIISRLQQERAALKRELEANEVGRKAAERNRNRQQHLLNEGISSERSYELSQMEYAKYVKDIADTEGKLARLDVRLSRQLTLEVRAPRSGVVQSILVGENSALVKPADEIALMVPLTNERMVELSIGGIDLPFIRINQPVQLQFEGWPVLQFSGLPELSVGTFKGRVQVIDPSADVGGNFRVLVRREENSIWPSAELLRQGVRARGWIQMNQVPVWYEIWRQANNLPPMSISVNPQAFKDKNDIKKDKSGTVKDKDEEFK